jgi:hypothetical protein
MRRLLMNRITMLTKRGQHRKSRPSDCSAYPHVECLETCSLDSSSF